jgi:hypothetical protein
MPKVSATALKEAVQVCSSISGPVICLRHWQTRAAAKTRPDSFLQLSQLRIRSFNPAVIYLLRMINKEQIAVSAIAILT